MSNRPILLSQFLDTLTTSRLANRNDHGVLSPHIAGVSLFLANLANILQCGTIELENLFGHNVTLVVSHSVNVVNVDDKLLIVHFQAGKFALLTLKFVVAAPKPLEFGPKFCTAR